jgi:O-antigen/teichoic acid export membrane protein
LLARRRSRPTQTLDVAGSWRTRLRAHARVPLYRSAYALTSSVVGSAALGALFWAVASHKYPPEVVGRSTAAVAALLFLTGAGSLNLDGASVRFLPRAGDATFRFVAWVLATTAVAATAAACIFLLGVPTWAPGLSFTVSSPWTVLACIGATVASCLLSVQDGVLIGLRQPTWVPIKNVALNGAKILMLLALGGSLATYGILVAWAVPSVVAAVGVVVLIARLARKHRMLTRARQERLDRGHIIRYAAGNYVGLLCAIAYRTVPPLLVLHQAGPRASAFFYPPWLIATSLSLLTTNMSVSLVVEGSFDRERLAMHTRQAVWHTARLILPLVLVLVVAAPWILRIFGAQYAAAGDNLLRLLAIGLVPSSVCILSFGVARVLDRVRAFIACQALLAGLVLALSWALLPSMGIDGVGVAWLVSQSGVALLLLWTQLLPLLRDPSSHGEGSAVAQPPAPTATLRQAETFLDVASPSEK